jgi:hypothetical protein
LVSAREAGQSLRDLSDAELMAIIAGAQPAPSAPDEPEAEHLPPDMKMN